MKNKGFTFLNYHGTAVTDGVAEQPPVVLIMCKDSNMIDRGLRIDMRYKVNKNFMKGIYK